MPSILTNLAKVSVARDFIRSFNSIPHYIGIGGILPWDTDPIPPSIENKDLTLNDVWRHSYAMKRIKSVDACLVAPRHNWTSGTVYDQYTDKETLSNKVYYVVTDTNDVFKCLYNNKNSVSIVKPTQSNVNTSDGYKWRWMYNIPTVLYNKFSTTSFIPIVDSPNNPVSGEITRIDIKDSGVSYTYANISIEGDGVGAGAYAEYSNGHISNIVLTNSGTGYNYAKVNINGDGINAEAEVILSPMGGHGYSPADELQAYYVMISIDLEYDETGYFLTNNEYRKIFIVREPLAYNSNKLYVENVAKTTTEVTLTSTATFTQDQEVQIWLNSEKIGTANIAYNDVANNTLYLCNMTVPVITQNHKIYDGFNQLDIVSNGIINSDVKIYSGKILYVMYNNPIFRNIAQSETIKIPILW